MTLTERLACRRSAACVLACLFLAAPAAAQRDLQDIPPPDPELERQTFVLPEGFKVNLFAADPAIAKPIQINFDPQGRLWIASSEVYPHIKPGEAPTDKILVLEDVDGDGVSDKTHVFAEGLLIPTGVAPGDGGAYVGASTELIHFADKDGDLKADSERVVLSGFGTEDTHHIIHTLRWGPAQRLYFSQSIYIHSHIETPWGVRRLNAGGIWQFRPDTLELDVFARGFINSWGTDFTDHGAVFATDGAGGEGINYVVPGASYATAHGAARILPGLNPGSPKHCGLEIVSSEHLPEDWQGDFLTNDFRGHRVCRFKVTEQGSGFVSQEQQELIKSDHVAFRPVDVKLGPDGAIYIADWYNPIIQHGEVDFRDPRRDHTHGRIWRVTYEGKPLVKRPQLVDAPTEELLAHLESPNVWTRTQAKRVLVERGPEVLDAVRLWARRLDNSRPDYHRIRLEALWLHLAFDVPEPELLKSLLQAKDSAARAAATRVLGEWHDRIDDSLALLTRRIEDDHGRVRLEAVRALAEIRDPRAIEIAARALDPPTERAVAETVDPGINRPAGPREFVFDQWLDYALWQTSRELQPFWEPALLSGEIDFGGSARHIAFVLKSAGSSKTVPVLVDLLRKEKVAEADLADVLDVIASFGSPQELQSLLELAVKSPNDPFTQQALAALLEAQRRRKAVPGGSYEALLPRADEASPAVQAAAARLVGAWTWEPGWEWLAATAGNAERPLEARLAAVEGMSQFNQPKAVQELKSLVANASPAAMQRAALIGLLNLRPQEAAREAAAWLSRTNDPAGAAPLLEAVLARPNAVDLLADAIAAGDRKLSSDVGVIALRSIRASGRRYPKLEEALSNASGISSEPKQLSPQELAALAERVRKEGDPARGERIYRRKDLSCLKCHSIGTAGGTLGPNMLSLGATAQPDYILESLLDPSAKVKEGYHTVVIVDDDGRQWAGIKQRQTDDSLILKNADGEEVSIPLNSIDVEGPGVSLMPAGLTEKLTQQELIDLAAFLGSLGRVPEYTIGQQDFARKWEVMEASLPAANQLRRTSYAQAATDDAAFFWQRSYSAVAGGLPVEDMPEVNVRNRVAGGARGMSFARTMIEASQGGPATLVFESTDGLQAWLNDQPLELQRETAIELSPGEHRLTIAVDRSVRTVPLKVALKLPEGGAAAKFSAGE